MPFARVHSSATLPLLLLLVYQDKTFGHRLLVILSIHHCMHIMRQPLDARYWSSCPLCAFTIILALLTNSMKSNQCHHSMIIYKLAFGHLVHETVIYFCHLGFSNAFHLLSSVGGFYFSGHFTSSNWYLITDICVAALRNSTNFLLNGIHYDYPVWRSHSLPCAPL